MKAMPSSPFQSRSPYPGPLDRGDDRIRRPGQQPDAKRGNGNSLQHRLERQLSDQHDGRNRTGDRQQRPDLVVHFEEGVVPAGKDILDEKNSVSTTSPNAAAKARERSVATLVVSNAGYK